MLFRILGSICFLVSQSVLAIPNISELKDANCGMVFRWKAWKESGGSMSYTQALKGQWIDFAKPEHFKYMTGSPMKTHQGNAPKELHDYRVFVKVSHEPTSGSNGHETVSVAMRVESKKNGEILAGPWTASIIHKVGQSHESPEFFPLLAGETSIAGSPLFVETSCGGEVEGRKSASKPR